MKIIGITSGRRVTHDNSIALLDDEKILFAEAEERLSRKKHDGRFPKLAFKEALKMTNTTLDEIDYFVTTDQESTIWKTFLFTLQYIPIAGIYSYLIQVIGRFMYKDVETFSKMEKTLDDFNIPKRKKLRVSHYLAHATTSYYFSPFKDCLVVTMDGYGLDVDSKPLSGKIYLGNDSAIEAVEDIPIHGSLGLYYGAVTMSLGFKLNDGEGKTMGLAAYGNPKKCLKQMEDFFPYFRDGRWVARDTIFDMLNISRTEVFQRSKTFKKLTQLVEKYGREDVAAAAQAVFERELERYMSYLVSKYKLRLVSVSGGIFLNMKANMRLLKNKTVDDLFVYPNPGDSGTALGAAVAGFLIKKGKFPQKEILHTYLGRGFSDSEIKTVLDETHGIVYRKLGANLAKFTAGRLAKGKVLGWFQGKGEWGPRALGHRSVIADPRKLTTKDRINKILKGREWFMPFAPSILEDRVTDYLVSLRKAPFMIIGDDTTKLGRKDLKATVHVDGTLRPHLVNEKIEPLYWKVIKEFEKLTGVGAILNTSFNKHGLPIVYSPKDAIEHLLWKAIDLLVIGGYLVERQNENHG